MGFPIARVAGWAGAVGCLVIAILSVSLSEIAAGDSGAETRVYLVFIFIISAIAVAGVLMNRFHPKAAAALRLISGILFWGILNFSLSAFVLIPAVLLVGSGLITDNGHMTSAD